MKFISHRPFFFQKWKCDHVHSMEFIFFFFNKKQNSRNRTWRSSCCRMLWPVVHQHDRRDTEMYIISSSLMNNGWEGKIPFDLHSGQSCAGIFVSPPITNSGPKAREWWKVGSGRNIWITVNCGNFDQISIIYILLNSSWKVLSNVFWVQLDTVNRSVANSI